MAATKNIVEPEKIAAPLDPEFLKRSEELGLAVTLADVSHGGNYRERAFGSTLELSFSWKELAPGCIVAWSTTILGFGFIPGARSSFIWWFLVGIAVLGLGRALQEATNRTVIRLSGTEVAISRGPLAGWSRQRWTAHAGLHFVVERKIKGENSFYVLVLVDDGDDVCRIHTFNTFQRPMRIATIANAFLLKFAADVGSLPKTARRLP